MGLKLRDTVGNSAVLKLEGGAIAVKDAGGALVPMKIGSAVGNDEAISKGQLDLRPTGMKNLLINGGFDVWQRGYTSSGIYQYCADRWNSYNSDSTTRGVDLVEGNFIACQNHTPNGAVLTQPLELIQAGVALFKIGEIVTISFRVRTLSQLNFTAIYRDGLVGANPVLLTDTIQASKGVANGSWETISFTFEVENLPAITNTCLIVGLISPTSGSFDIAQVQLELGSVATPFEQRPIGLELSLCQRYYEVGVYSYTPTLALGNPTQTLTFKATKRVPPILTGDFYSEAHPNTAITTYRNSRIGSARYYPVAHFTVPTHLHVRWTADAEIY